MVTATTGTAIWKGLSSGKIYQTSLYISDVAAARVLWSQSGAATASSPNQLQFNEAVQLMDISVISGPTVITGFSWNVSDTPIPSTNQAIATIYTTIQTRSFNPIGFKTPGALISATQF